MSMQVAKRVRLRAYKADGTCYRVAREATGVTVGWVARGMPAVGRTGAGR